MEVFDSFQKNAAGDLLVASSELVQYSTVRTKVDRVFYCTVDRTVQYSSGTYRIIVLLSTRASTTRYRVEVEWPAGRDDAFLVLLDKTG